MKSYPLQLMFKIVLGSVVGLGGCAETASPNLSVEVQKKLNSVEPNASVQLLPKHEEIKFGKLQYIPAQVTPNAALEKAILKQLSGYDYCQGDESSQGVRYFYNLMDLNNDGNSETIVYLVGTYSCGSGGCKALIFQSLGSDYQLISSLTLVNNPIIISDQKTGGWRDLILYVTGGGAKGSYRVLRFNSEQYPSNPSIQPSLPSGSFIAGTALIANQIVFETPAPTLSSENCDSTPFKLMQVEGFGELTINITATQVFQLLGNPETKGEKVVWGADGLDHQYWYYPEQGITLEMVSEAAENSQRVASIKIKSPSKLKTQRGIGIGDTYTEVMQAYREEEEQKHSFSSQQFVAGSIYGGLIFSFQNGQVTEIFLGAAAE